MFTNMVTGIDCSKDYFDIAVLDNQKIVFTDRFSNDQEGFEKLIPHVTGSHLVMEATGPYSFQLAKFLYLCGEKVSVENPLKIRRFAQMHMSRAKTDKKDAIMIAKYGSLMNPEEWKLPEEFVLHIRHLESYLNNLKDRRGMLRNELHAFESSGSLRESLQQDIKEELQRYEDSISKKEQEIADLIKKHYAVLSENLRSIPGLGARSVSLLIVKTDGLQNFESYKKVVSYFGLAPRTYESGISVKGKGHIWKVGTGQVRKVLYMAAISAVRCNKACKELYERMIAKGKPYKVAIIAVVNKLIKQAFAIAKSGNPYQEQRA